MANEEMPREIARLEDENEELQQRINKAIEYIEDNIGESNNHLYFEVLDEEIEDFLNILKGSE